MSTVINVTGVTPTPIIINGVGTVQQIIATGVITQRGEQGVPGPTGPAGTTDFNLLTNKPTLGTSAAKDIPATGNASAIEVVYGTDTRLTDSRPASDVSAWAKAPTKPTYTNTEVGAAATVHTHAISDTTGLQTSLDGKVDENVAITGATKTKITYDAKGLVTAGADATTADIADSTNKRYVTDANLTVIGNTSGTNTGDNATNSQYSGLAASKQDKDATLTALAAYNTNGILTQTAADTFAGRTITGTTNQITVTNGDGVAGNPTLALPQNIHTGATPTFAGGTINGKLDITTTGINTVLGTSTSVTGDANIDVTHLGTSSNTNRMKINHYSRNSAGTMLINSQIQTRLSDTTAGSEVSQFAIQGYSGGVYGVVFNIDYGNIYNVGSISPRTNLLYSIGSSGNYWANVYTNKIFLNSTATLDGSTAGQVNLTGEFSVNGVKSIYIPDQASFSGSMFFGNGGRNLSYISGTNGRCNNAMGYNALLSNTTGSLNNAMGYEALKSNTTGVDNNAMGYLAMADNTTGHYNSAQGNSALRSNTTGSFNSALGLLSLYTNNGSSNSGLGTYALYANTTGSNNSAVGSRAGRYIADGSTANAITNNSVFIGYNTKALANNQTNQTVIGYDAIGNGSNTVTIGNSSVTGNFFSGNIESTTVSGGVILKSPDGTRYKLTIANGGTVTVSAA